MTIYLLNKIPYLVEC